METSSYKIDWWKRSSLKLCLYCIKTENKQRIVFKCYFGQTSRLTSFFYSPVGGMSIEDVAHKDPSKIFKYHVNTFEGLDVDKLLEAADNLGIKE